MLVRNLIIKNIIIKYIATSDKLIQINNCSRFGLLVQNTTLMIMVIQTTISKVLIKVNGFSFSMPNASLSCC